MKINGGGEFLKTLISGGVKINRGVGIFWKIKTLLGSSIQQENTTNKQRTHPSFSVLNCRKPGRVSKQGSHDTTGRAYC